MKQWLSAVPVAFLFLGILGFLPDDGVVWHMPFWLAVTLTVVGGVWLLCWAILVRRANNG